MENIDEDVIIKVEGLIANITYTGGTNAQVVSLMIYLFKILSSCVILIRKAIQTMIPWKFVLNEESMLYYEVTVKKIQENKYCSPTHYAPPPKLK